MSKYASNEEIIEYMRVHNVTRDQARAAFSYRVNRNNLRLKDSPELVGLWQKKEDGWVLIKKY